MSTTNWQSHEAATVVGPTFARVQIPAFDVQDIEWAGASYSVRQYNYTATKKFVLKNRPTKPSTANFVPCIKYRMGETVYRYKLWEDEKLIADIPLYNGELIRKNFCIEIWSLEDETTAVNLADRSLITNRHVDRVDIRDYTTLYALADAALASIDAPIVPSYTDDDITVRADAGEVIDLTWPVSETLLDTAISLTIDSRVNGVNGTANFFGARISSEQTLDNDASGNLLGYLVFKADDIANAGQLLNKFGKDGKGMVSAQGNTLDIYWDAVAQGSLVLSDDSSWYIFKWSQNHTTNLVTVSVYDCEGTLLQTSDFAGTAGGNEILTIGDPLGTVKDIAEVISYNSELAAVDETALFAYFKARYFTGDTLPLVFDGVAWLDNSDDDADLEEDLTVLTSGINNYALDYFYLRSPEDGLLYKVNITDVDGTKSFQIAQTPTTL